MMYVKQRTYHTEFAHQYIKSNGLTVANDIKPNQDSIILYSGQIKWVIIPVRNMHLTQFHMQL